MKAPPVSISRQKMCGPSGVGALVVRDGAPFVPDRLGGGQESNRRAGTENLPGISGFGVAAMEANSGLATTEWRNLLERTLLEIAPAARVYGAGADRLPNTTCISMPGVRATQAE